MRAQFGAIFAVDAMADRFRRSKAHIYQSSCLVVVALCLSGCAVPLREGLGLSHLADPPRHFSEFSIVVGSIETNARTIASVALRFLQAV